MRTPLLFALLILVTRLSWGESPSTLDQGKLASTLIIDKLVMHQATPMDAFDFIQRKSVALDPAKKGIDLVFDGVSDSLLDPKEITGGVTYSLKNVSVLEAIRTTSKAVGLEVTAEFNQIRIHPKRK